MKSLNYFRLLFLWKTFRLFKWIQQNIIDCFLNAIFRYSTAYGTQEEAEKSVKEYENSAQLVNVVSNHTIAFFALQAKDNQHLDCRYLTRLCKLAGCSATLRVFTNKIPKKIISKQFSRKIFKTIFKTIFF
jgi:hypothetical protein